MLPKQSYDQVKFDQARERQARSTRGIHVRNKSRRVRINDVPKDTFYKQFANQDVILVDPNGVVKISRRVYKNLGEPERICLDYDAGILYLVPDDTGYDGCKISDPEGATLPTLTSRKLLSFLHLEFPERTQMLWYGRMEGDEFAVDVETSPMLVLFQKRGKNDKVPPTLGI